MRRSAQGRIQCGSEIDHGVPFFKTPSISKSNFWRLFVLFEWNFHRVLYSKALNLHFFMWFPYIKDLLFKNLMIFCIDLGEGRGAPMHVHICMGTHSKHLIQNNLMDVYEPWYIFVKMRCSWPRTCIQVFGLYLTRADPGQSKNR